MKGTSMRGRRLVTLWLLFLFVGSLATSPASAAEVPPYEFSAQLSLTGGCGTSKADPAPDPGCPEEKPPKAFTQPRSIAIDSFGDEYVASYGAEEGKQGRIDFFSPKGVYIGEVIDDLGPKNVAIDSTGVLYTFDQSPGHDGEFARYKPIAYKPTEERIEYGPRELIATKSGPTVGGLSIDSNNHVLVDWSFSIAEYNSAAEGNELKGTFNNPKLQSSAFIALDKTRRLLYASSCPNGNIAECWVLVFDADTHNLLEEVEGPNPSTEPFASGKGWISIAVDEETGDFFVGDLEATKNVYQFNRAFEHISTLAINPELFEGGEAMQIAVSNAPKGTANEHYLFVPSLRNRALAFSPPKEQPPSVESVSISGIGETEAELLATIEPKGGVAEYRFEYLSQREYEEAGNSFTGAEVASKGTILPSEREAEVSVPISGLQPETAYRFRVFAKNGTGSDEVAAVFTTYNDASITTECPEAVRSSYSTLLPDCRAYELVTPPDTNGRPPRGVRFVGDRFATSEASPNGDAISFLTEGGVIPGLGGTGSFNGDLYHAIRTASGWSTDSAGPTGAETSSVDAGSTAPDQGYSFWTATQVGSAVIEGDETHYVRYPDGHSALIGRGSEATDPRARGKLITEGGTHIVFETNPVNSSKQPIQLEPKAAPTGTQAVYDRTLDEVTHVVSLPPNGEPFKAGEDAEYVGASADGEGIAFSVGGTLYVRLNDAETLKVGENVTFAGVSEGGKRVFYVKGDNLFAFETETEEAIPFTNTGNVVPVNVSADGTRAYFVSTTAILTAGPNPNGIFAKNKQQNLYLSEEGEIRFVGTLTERDVIGESRADGKVDGLGLWTSAVGSGRLAINPSRLNHDGSVMLFQSRANLTGYEHKEVPEIYRYDSVAERLQCISCIPTKTPATGGASLESIAATQDQPEPFSSFGFVQNLRADGKRAFFQSAEALVSTDNDETQDVYEWEEQDQGTCTRSGGCIYLISSGRSAKKNYLYAISESGDDVFFATGDVLVGGDDNTISIYDARVNGGFAEEHEEECVGEACRPDLSPPPALTRPESGVRSQSGNALTPRKHCPVGMHKATRNGKRVCIKKRKKHHGKHSKAKKGMGK